VSFVFETDFIARDLLINNRLHKKAHFRAYNTRNKGNSKSLEFHYDESEEKEEAKEEAGEEEGEEGEGEEEKEEEAAEAAEAAAAAAAAIRRQIWSSDFRHDIRRCATYRVRSSR
jgi:hypothetical protein